LPTVHACTVKPRKKPKTITQRLLELSRRLSRLRLFVLRSLRNLSSRVSILEGAVEEVALLRTQLAALQGQVAGSQGQIAALQAQVAGSQGQIVALQAQAADNQGQIAALQVQVNTLQGQVQLLLQPLNEIIEQLQSRIGTVVTLETDAGTITGTLTFVGSDFAQILEPTGSIALVRVQSINAIA